MGERHLEKQLCKWNMAAANGRAYFLVGLLALPSAGSIFQVDYGCRQWQEAFTSWIVVAANGRAYFPVGIWALLRYLVGKLGQYKSRGLALKESILLTNFSR